MLYREFLPSPDLRDRVDCLWILDAPTPPTAETERVVPDGRVELIFHLGEPYRRVGDPDNRQPRSFAIGQMSGYLELEHRGHASILGARLRPTALHRTIGGGMQELTDRSIALDDLGLPTLANLEERLHATRSWPERVRLLHDALRRALRPDPGPIGVAVELIRAHHGALDLATVAERVGLSRRTLDRRFPREVGVTPKLLARQTRFRRVFDLLEAGARPSWADLAAATGCYDQAHLTREFRAFTGEPPAAYLRSEHELADHLTGMTSARRDAAPA